MTCATEFDHRWKLREDGHSFTCDCGEQRFKLLTPCDVATLGKFRYNMRQRVYTKAEAEARVAIWQSRFRLTDWDITVEIVRQSGFQQNGFLLGEMETMPSKAIAVIRLLDPIDFRADLGFIDKHDHELTIIHELLHVRLSGVRGRKNRESCVQAEERAVHALSTVCAMFDLVLR